ncbi:MAG TPA: imidazole glycerol phosphate synthase subunit HisH [Thermomicrobiales bacterium]|nr:imidazole glycerol phosphate synthase subunit HisH [Thermomicrobiales bacterium]
MIAIVDYGAGNLRSIGRALSASGAEIEVTADPDRIHVADRVVLPGVGNARAAMTRLTDSGMADAIRETVDAGTPLLGICLGMQLLFGPQEEGPTTGLGLLAGEVRHLPDELKVPHMGWNTVTFVGDSPLQDHPSAPFYFVHSYAATPENPHDIAAITDYGVSFPSIVIHNHVWGMQFHPEKSGDSGLNLLNAWLTWNP